MGSTGGRQRYRFIQNGTGCYGADLASSGWSRVPDLVPGYSAAGPMPLAAAGIEDRSGDPPAVVEDSGTTQHRRSGCIELICAPQDTSAESIPAAPNGGYLRASADQRLLQTVTRFQARRRAADYVRLPQEGCSTGPARRRSSSVRPSGRMARSHREYDRAWVTGAR